MCCCWMVISCGSSCYNVQLFNSPHTNTYSTLQLCVCGFAAHSEAVVQQVCALISRHSSGLSGRRCWLRLGGQVSLLPHGRAIHYSQSWEKSGRKIRSHRPTELGSIDCAFLFRSTRWPLAHWRRPQTTSDKCSDSKQLLELLAHHGSFLDMSCSDIIVFVKHKAALNLYSEKKVPLVT